MGRTNFLLAAEQKIRSIQMTEFLGNPGRKNISKNFFFIEAYLHVITFCLLA
jgi:hypothetical protein